MSLFKVGDRVRCVVTSPPGSAVYQQLEVGRCYRVTGTALSYQGAERLQLEGVPLLAPFAYRFVLCNHEARLV